jgi:hypothetical protein
MIFLNPKADIPNFYGDITKVSGTAKFMYHQILITQTMYQWPKAVTVKNLKLALRGRAIDWLSYINYSSN